MKVTLLKWNKHNRAAALLLVIPQDNKTLRNYCEENQEYRWNEFVSDEVIHCDVKLIKT